jgi:hypothetical protein
MVDTHGLSGDKVRAGADAISDAIVANDVIWSFFQQYKLP